MTSKDATKILIIAAITTISVTLTGYLFLTGTITLGWALALLVGFVIVAILGYLFDK